MSNADDKIDYMLVLNFLAENYDNFSAYCNGDYELVNEILNALEEKANEK